MRDLGQTIRGAIFGQAIGDALGHPREFSKSITVTTNNVPERFTDDTQMMAAIGEAMLLSPPHLSNNAWEPFMTTLGTAFADWYRKPLGGSHRSPGGACQSAAGKLGTGSDWLRSGGLSAKGNGAAMRSSIVGCAYWKNPYYAFRVGCMTAVPTHNNLEAILTAGMVSYLVAESINGTPFHQSVHQALKLAHEYSSTVPLWPSKVPIGYGYSDQNPAYVVAHISKAYMAAKAGMTPKEFREYNGDDFATVPAVAAAVFYNARHNNYTDTVLGLVNHTGDCDTTAAIGGAIAGARYGFQFIRGDWTSKVELADYFENLSGRILTLSEQYTKADTPKELART